jgi:hypothetical protein
MAALSPPQRLPTELDISEARVGPVTLDFGANNSSFFDNARPRNGFYESYGSRCK